MMNGGNVNLNYEESNSSVSEDDVIVNVSPTLLNVTPLQKNRIIETNKESNLQSLNLRRRKSEVEKSLEIHATRKESILQYENLVKMADTIQSKDTDMEILQEENVELTKQIRVLTTSNNELNRLNSELTKKLQMLQQLQMRQRIEQEDKVMNKSVEDSWHKSLTSVPHDQYITDLLANNQRLETRIEEITEENRKFKSELAILRKQLNKGLKPEDIFNQNVEALEDRSKAHLLSIIRESMVEKVGWKGYACNLTRMVVQYAPQLLNLDEATKRNFATKNEIETNWTLFGRRVMTELSKSHGSLSWDYLESLIEVPYR